MVWPTDADQKLGEYDAMELPGQQLRAAHAASRLDHLLNLDIKAPPGCQRLTGIMATIGKASSDFDIMKKMIASGMNIAVINTAYGSRDDHIENIKMLRQAAKEFSVNMNRNFPLGIAMRMCGRKIRTGCISDTYGETVELKEGDTVRLTSDETYRDRGSASTLFIDFMNFGDQLNKGNIIMLDNEAIILKVEVISSTTVTCKIEMGGILGSYKNVFIPNVIFNMPNFSEKDQLDINLIAVHQQVDMVIIPLVHNIDSINEMRGLLGEKGKKISIIATIQSTEGYRNFDSIMGVANGIMISRQELGSDISPKKLVIAQKNMIARANKMNIPISISAQLLNSMKTKRSPLRAELMDISNCILDGADAMVISSETSIGQFPIETVACMASACKEAEACIWTKQVYHDLVDKTDLPCDQPTAAAMSAVLASQRSIAAAIVVVTTTGKSAQLVAKYRARCPVFAVTRYPTVARQLHLWRGLIPLIYEDSPDTDWQMDLERRVNFCVKWGMEQGFIRVGDPLVLVSGWRQGTGFTNTVRVIYAAAETTVF